MLSTDIPTQINQMMAEIESGLIGTGIDIDNPIHRTYVLANMELSSPDCDQRYVHNILATALNKPLATRH